MMEQNMPMPDPPPDAFYRNLCQHTPVAMIATDSHFNIISCNSASGRLLGLDASGMIGMQIHMVVPEHRRNLLDKLLRRTIGKNETSQFEVRLPSADGHPKILMVVLAPVRDENSQPQGIAVWFIDETESRHVDERIASRDRMAAVATLAAGVAHHFNNILGGIATSVDYSLTSGDIVSMKKALQLTSDGIMRASKITQALLKFAERDTRRPEPADLTEIVIGFTHLVEKRLQRQNIQLHLDLKPIPIIPVDANRLQHVLGSLLTNAEEAMPKGGNINISIDRHGDEIVLTFKDTGCGIRQENMHLLFQPFFTTKGTLAGGNQQNVGLGLAVVHGMVMDMGGTISVESTPGQGTTFYIHLPVQQKPMFNPDE